MFDDIANRQLFGEIVRLAEEGITTGGCFEEPGHYCLDRSTTRAQTAAFPLRDALDVAFERHYRRAGTKVADAWTAEKGCRVVIGRAVLRCRWLLGASAFASLVVLLMVGSPGVAA